LGLKGLVVVVVVVAVVGRYLKNETSLENVYYLIRHMKSDALGSLDFFNFFFAKKIFFNFNE
jgi:hypothetical protein